MTTITSAIHEAQSQWSVRRARRRQRYQR